MRGLPTGVFIALEGIDGAGTTTQARLLADALAHDYPDREVVCTREPSNTPITAMIRRWLNPDDEGMPPKAMCLAFLLDRCIHLRDVVEPALQRGAVVVTDRYKLSTMAYQTLDLPWNVVEDLCKDHRDPDLYVFLDLPVDVALARVLVRSNGTPDRYETDAKQRRVAANYYRALDCTQHTPSHVLHTDGCSILQVSESVRKVVRASVNL